MSLPANDTRYESRMEIGRFELGLILTQAVFGIGLLAWMLWACRRGIDFTDEGFYLNWIAHPFLYEASHTLFGFIYHPIYSILGNDLVALRQANVLLTVGIAWILFRVLLNKVLFTTSSGTKRMGLAKAALALALSTSSLGIFNIIWIPTPGYNTLALQALMITGVGIMLSETVDSKVGWIGWGLIGVGGWLAFMAKPTTALILGAIVFAHCVISGSTRLRYLTISLLVSLLLLLCSALYIDGSVPDFIGRLSDGAMDMGRLQAGYELSTLFRMDSFSFSRLEACFFSLSLFILCLAGMLPDGKYHKINAFIPSLMTSLYLVIFALALHRLLVPYWLPYLGLQHLAIPAGAVLLAILGFAKKTAHIHGQGRIGLALCLLFIPYAYALGTNNNYWSTASRASVFWVTAGLLMLPSKLSYSQLKYSILSISASVLLTITWVIYSNIERPYRQTSSLVNNDRVTPFASGANILLSEDFAQYIERLQKLALHSGFKNGDPMLDWTGHYPTLHHAIGSMPVGHAWLCGGWPGSDDMVAAVLDRVPRAILQRAWILTEPDGVRALSPKLLKRYGIDLDKDYTLVGSLDSPTGTFPTSYKQYLWRPSLPGS